MFNRVKGFFSSDLSIDLGTANTLVYVRGKGVVLNEPSVVAVSTTEYNAANPRSIRAIGSNAKDMLGRTPENIQAIRPLKDGVIADFTLTEKMLQHFIGVVHGNTIFKPSPRILICVPCGATPVDKRAIREAALGTGARKVYLVEEPMAAAMGAELPVSDALGSMIVDIGGGTAEVAVISLRGIVCSNSVKIGGDKFNEAIISYIRRNYNTLIGEVTAERVKHELGCAIPPSEVREMEISGQSQAGHVPRSIALSSNEILEALEEPLTGIINAVRDTLERTPPELSADVIERGIVLTGGGALLQGLDELLMKESGVTVIIAEDPLTCVVRGGGRFLEMIDEFGEDVLIFE